MIVAIVFVEQGQRRIPVQFAKRVVGRRMYGGQSTYIPLKVNQSGVIPVIFASSILSLPGAASPTCRRRPSGLGVHVQLDQRQPRRAAHEPGSTSPSTALLIIFFAYFYTAIAFNPHQQADIIRKQGGFIPGIRPGPPDRALPRQGPQPHHAARLAVPRRHRADPPLLVFAALGHQRSSRFGGTSILITVGVALETMKQIDSQLMMRNYEGFLKS